MSSSSLPKVPDHELLRPIGRGAYGEVWLARNAMGTLRAVKVIWRRQFESERPFEREFAGIQRYEPVSRSSGGLVHVLHVGRNNGEGYFYYVMELADAAEERLGPELRDPEEAPAPRMGPNPASASAPAFGFQIPGGPKVSTSDLYRPRTLRSDLKRLGRLPTADCLRLAIDAASGLGQLHRHGLVHRDVKPGNIIYVNGRAKVADIGPVTAEGEGRTFVGTEGYIPPEGPGTPAADLYALGVALYEASTGYSPERLPDLPPEWLAEGAGDEALELHEVILKASEGQRERRYGGVEALQADLALLQSGQSVRQARALRRRYARLRVVGAVGTTCLALALVSAFVANYRARVAAEGRAHETRLRQEAQQARAQAENAEREGRRQFQTALYEEARALVLSQELGHRSRALEVIRQAGGSTNATELRRVAFAALGMPDLRLEREAALPGPLLIASIDPNLERIARGGGPQGVTICSLPELGVLASLPPSGPSEAFVGNWSPEGGFLAVKRQWDSLGSRSDLEVWNARLGLLSFVARSNIASDCFSFHPKQPRLMAGRIGGAVSVWDLGSGREERPFNLPGTPCALAYSPDGARVAASYPRGSNWVVAFHDAASGALLGAAEMPEPAQSLTWHPGGHWVGIVGYDATEWNRGVRLIAPDSGAVTLLGRHKIKTAGLSFSPDGNYLMSCGWERELVCWDWRTRQRAFTCADSGYDVTWSPDGRRCAMVPRTRPRVQLYAFQRPACLGLVGNRGERLRPGAFSPDGRWLAVPDNRNLCVWDLRSMSPPAVLAARSVQPPFFSADGAELFALDRGSGESRLKAWRLADGPSPTAAPQATPLAVAGPPDLSWAGLAGDDLLLASDEGLRRVARTNLAAGQGSRVKMPAGPGSVSSDGQRLALTSSFSPYVTVYSLPELKPVARLRTAHYVSGVWFSPAGDELTVINRGGIERWETVSWQRNWHETGSPMSDSYAFYAPDGRGLWRVTSFRDAALCDARTLDPVLPLPPNVLPLAVSSDGRQLAVSVDDQRVQVWDMRELHASFRELGLDWETPPGSAAGVAAHRGPAPGP